MDQVSRLDAWRFGIIENMGSVLSSASMTSLNSLCCVPTGEEDTELSGDGPPGTEGLDEESEALSTLASVSPENLTSPV